MMLDSGCWMLDAGYWMPDSRYRMLGGENRLSVTISIIRQSTIVIRHSRDAG
ncbi:MAG: hypothetical protein QNJ58_17725 [Desulfobacterales bacterium]|nr:hypothetical protein [Desulfobacterales bacterium]